MDPNANLKEQLQLMEEILDERTGNAAILAKAVRLAELVDALDGWLYKGGFLPERWSAHRP